MCLLVVLHRVHPHAPLIVGANRDELLARPAVPMKQWTDRSPRLWAGQDLQSGGTWLAMNDRGVFAGVTNQPGGRRDPSLKSRGEWPLVLAGYRHAADAAAAFVANTDPGSYAPGWILVGDAESLTYIDMTGSEPELMRLEAGIHVLENVPLEAPSPKARAVRQALADIAALPWPGARAVLEATLRSHAIPAGAEAFARVPGMIIPAETHAPCVHAGAYGTRTSAILVANGGGPSEFRFTDGPPCTHPYVSALDHT
jgi:uncharacterized protein with NRDE domain